MNDKIMVLIAIPIFVITMLLEYWWIHRRSDKNPDDPLGYTLKDTVASLGMGLGFLAIRGLWQLALIPFFYWVYQFRVFEIPRVAWSWFLLVILQDLAYYWYHRTHHEFRFLWASHVNHHSSIHYNLSTALRQSWTASFTEFVFFMPLMFLGFHPLDFLAVGLLNLFYQYWIHTETIVTLGWFEHVFMTPSHHRVHHGTNSQYLDRNHGGLLIVWDKMFRTFEPEDEKVVYGITSNINSYNLIWIAFHEWVGLFRDVLGAESLRMKLQYIFKPPGWVPEKTAPSKVSSL